jgi:hypothetical protein
MRRDRRLQGATPCMRRPTRIADMGNTTCPLPSSVNINFNIDLKWVNATPGNAGKHMKKRTTSSANTPLCTTRDDYKRGHVGEVCTLMISGAIQ